MGGQVCSNLLTLRKKAEVEVKAKVERRSDFLDRVLPRFYGHLT